MFDFLLINAFPWYEASLAGIFFLAAIFCRTICNIGFFDRPLTLGLLWATVTGEVIPALPLAVFFELFWIDQFSIGSFLPPMAGFSLLLLLPLATVFDWYTPSALLMPLIMVLPLAYVPVVIEKWQRRQHDGDYIRLLRMAGKITFLPSKSFSILLRFTGMTLVSHAGMFIICIGVLFFLWAALTDFLNSNQLNIQWIYLYMAGGLGGVMALRITRAYILFVGTMLAVLAIRILG